MRLLLVAALLAVGLTSCAGDAPRSASGSVPRPSAFRSDLFPDVPFWVLGSAYRMDLEQPQLAVAYAGGSLRRLAGTWVSKDDRVGEEPVRVLDRCATALLDYGWIRGQRSEVDGEMVERWTRPGEILDVRAGRSGDTTTVRLLIDPAPAH